jgi:hypothetical protein
MRICHIYSCSAAPESTGAGPKPTGSFSTTTTSSYSPTPSASGGDDSGTNGSGGNTSGGDSGSAAMSKKSPAGAIAGAIVGVLGGLAIIAGFVFSFIRRRRAKTAPSATYAFNAQPSDAALNASPPMSQHSHNLLSRLYVSRF